MFAEMAERSIAPDCKSGVRKGYLGSNPSLGTMPYYTYVLYSKNANKYYVGSTGNLGQRLQAHNAGKSKWTSKYRPVDSLKEIP